MNYANFVFLGRHPLVADVALLLMRLVAGVTFILTGSGKVVNPTGWLGPDAFAPGWLQALAAFFEFVGGIALILGLLVPLFALGIACVMATAVGFHISSGHAFVAMGGGPSWNVPAALFTVALVLIAVGPGRASLDYLLCCAQRTPPTTLGTVRSTRVP